MIVSFLINHGKAGQFQFGLFCITRTYDLAVNRQGGPGHRQNSEKSRKLFTGNDLYHAE